jgi:hypothetical protein
MTLINQAILIIGISLIPSLSLAASGDTIQSGVDIGENYMWEQANRVEITYGGLGYMYLGDDADGDMQSPTIVWQSAGDSLDGWDVSAMYLGIVCEAVTGTWDAGDSVFIRVAKRDVRENGCWNYFKSEVELYDSAWTTPGGLHTNDFIQSIDSFSLNGIAAGDTIIFDITLAADSSYLWLTGNTATSQDYLGFIIVINAAAEANGEYLKFTTDEALPSVNEPFIVATYTYSDSMIIEPGGCDEAGFGAGDIYMGARYPTGSFDAEVDSIKIRFDDGTGSVDSVVAAIYRAYGDSSMIDSSNETYVADGGDGCEDVFLEFGDAKVKADSEYFWGCFVYDFGDANDYDICRIGSELSAGVYDVAAAVQANMQGATSCSEQFLPCFTAYLSFWVADASQVIIIGACESEETPYYNAGDDIYANVFFGDPVFTDR